jgi:hypothetical protein
MSLVASTLINEVRDLAFVGPELASNATILRALVRAERELYEAAIQINPDPLAISEDVTVTDPSDGDAITLASQFYLLLDALATLDNGDRQVVMVIPAAQRLETEHFTLAIYQHGQSLYFRSLEDGDEWTDVASINVRYVPLPDAPTTLSGNLTAPDFCARFLVLRAACFIRQFVAGGKKDPDIEREALEAKQQLLAVFANQDSTTTWSTRVLD